jgi:hypothetical protein
MELKNGHFCPLIKKDCVGLKCVWFTQVRGTNPNTGKEVDEWACAVAWLPVLLIENSQQSFRNEMVKANEKNTQTMLGVAIKPTLTLGD